MTTTAEHLLLEMAGTITPVPTSPILALLPQEITLLQARVTGMITISDLHCLTLHLLIFVEEVMTLIIHKLLLPIMDHLLDTIQRLIIHRHPQREVQEEGEAMRETFIEAERVMDRRWEPTGVVMIPALELLL